MSLIDDEVFQDSLVSLILKDRTFLKQHGHLVSSGDFEPKGSSPRGRDRWLIATKALDHWGKYSDPIGRLIGSEITNHCKIARFSPQRSKGLIRYTSTLYKAKPQVRPITDRLLEWKRAVVRAEAINKIIELNESGELTHEEWISIVREVMLTETGLVKEPEDFFEKVEDRILRRSSRSSTRFPALMIDPLDKLTRAIARGHLGMIVGPYKRGKSMFLLWIAKSYSLQGLNVLYITMEDQKEDVEDRLDAMICEVPIKDLDEYPNRVRLRFERFRRLIDERMEIYDYTDSGISVKQIEALWQMRRDQGWTADAVIIDYDAEINPDNARSQKYEQLDSIYQGLRRFAARNQVLVWTATQTKRGTSEQKIISGDEVAEALGKTRKVAMALSMGQGEWGPDSLYLLVAAHKYDKGGQGCNIMPDRSRMMIYDHEATLDMMKREALQQEEEEEEAAV